MEKGKEKLEIMEIIKIIIFIINYDDDDICIYNVHINIRKFIVSAYINKKLSIIEVTNNQNV